VTEIQEKGAGLLSLNDNIDTTTPHGKLTFHIFAAIAEFEREIIRERTNAGSLLLVQEGARVAVLQAFRQRRKSKPQQLIHFTSRKSLLPRYATLWAFARRLFTNTLII
jgi:DNA invertase Pin-like site-specific DNA recombinase